MTEVIQRFLLKNTKFLQYIVNDKLAKRKGSIGKFFRWMEIGERQNGTHYSARWFRVFNHYMLTFGFRFNWGKPSFMKIFSREREIFIVGYAALFGIWAWFARKNKIRPLYRYKDQLNDYDNPTTFSKKYGIYIPFNYLNYRISAHYIEINKIYHLEMLKRVIFPFITI